VVPTPTDPMGFLKSTRDFKAPSAVKEHTNEVRGGGRDPGVRRPGAGLGQSPARTKIFRAAMHSSSRLLLNQYGLGLAQRHRPRGFDSDTPWASLELNSPIFVEGEVRGQHECEPYTN